MKKRLLLALSALLCAGLFLTGCTPAANNNNGGPITLQTAGGSVGGTWYSTMASLADLLMQKDDSIEIKTVPGTGVSNSAKIGSNDVQMGWTFPPFTKLAFDGKAPYDQAYGDLRSIAAGFSPNVLELTVTADSGINSLEELLVDMKPAKFVTNKKDTTPAIFLDMVFAHYNLTAKDIEANGGKVINTTYSDWPQLIQDGHANVMWNQIAVPSPTNQEISSSKALKLLPLPQSLREVFINEYAFEDVVIPAGTYAWQKEDIATVQITNELTVNKSVSDETVYRILEILDENIEEVKQIHASWAGFDITKAWQSTGAPLHPGAEKFYKDKGYMK